MISYRFPTYRYDVFTGSCSLFVHLSSNETVKSPLLLTVLVNKILHSGVPYHRFARVPYTRYPLQISARGPFLINEKRSQESVKVSALNESAANERWFDDDAAVGHADDEAAIQRR